MRNMEEYAKNLYVTHEYILKHPSVHEEDSPWKVRKIIPLVDTCIRNIPKNEINVLDVGGGGGLILNAISLYIKENYSIKVKKFALDLSPEMLEIQKNSNPDLTKALNEDIRKTSLANKEIDITLMIDLLEHVPDPARALEEGKRISDFVILKVPLEDNLHLRIMNRIRRGKVRERLIETFGHINVYDFSELRHQIERHMGQILEFYFTNAFDYYLGSEYYKRRSKVRSRLMYSLAACMSRLSPESCSLVFRDFVMILAKCR